MPDTKELFSRHSLRCTRQRVAVFEALRESRSHPTAEELFSLVRPTTDRLSLATVYNTLETLCEAGLARKLPTPSGTCRYDADTSVHVHVRILETDEIADVPDDLGDRLLESLPPAVLARIERELGVRVESLNLQLVARKS